MAEHLTPTDASMLAIEDADHGMHLQIIYVFEGDPPTFDEFRGDGRAAPARRAPVSPAGRRRCRYGLGRPVWVDDERFDLDYHLRRTALPAPGSEDELRTLSNRLLQQPLDLRRALWEMWMVEGLADDRFAIIHRVHHCMVDGVATQDISGMMFSRDAARGAPGRRRVAPAGQPGGVELVASGIADFATKGGAGRHRNLLRSRALAAEHAAQRRSGREDARPPLRRDELGAADDARIARAARAVAPIGCGSRWTTSRRPRRRTARRSTTSSWPRATGALRRYFLRHGEPLPTGMRAMVPGLGPPRRRARRPEQPGLGDLPGAAARRGRSGPAGEPDRRRGRRGCAAPRASRCSGSWTSAASRRRRSWSRSSGSCSSTRALTTW